MRNAVLLAAAAIPLSACATTRGGAADAPAAATAARITYDTAACFGTCPVYSVEVDLASGAGVFMGRQHTATVGAARFQATPAQVRAFGAAVAELRGVDGEGVTIDGARCVTYATDLPGVTVTWIGADGARTVKRAYFGCGVDTNRALFASLRSVPDVLPITPLIGR